MQLVSDNINHILALLRQGPICLENATRGIDAKHLSLRTEEEPWSVGDILAHLRACSDVWGDSIMKMLTQENPVQRYVSPRSLLRKPEYTDPPFETALESFAQARKNLLKMLEGLDEASWARSGTFTGTSPRARDQTVFSYAERIVNHEQDHLAQIEMLLRG
ncbi:MAG: DinB family protein [Anaerolineales bacterium]|nr:DinB family protein [Anaerolineales bacterium]